MPRQDVSALDISHTHLHPRATDIESSQQLNVDLLTPSKVRGIVVDIAQPHCDGRSSR